MLTIGFGSGDNNAMALQYGFVDAFAASRKNNAFSRYNYLPPPSFLMHRSQQQRTPTLHYLSLADNIFSSQTKNINDVEQKKA